MLRRQLAIVALATTSLVVLALLIPLARAVSTIPRDRALSRAQLTSQGLVQSIGAVRDRTQLEQLINQTSDLNGQALSVVLPDGSRLGKAFVESAAFLKARKGASLSARIADGVEVLTPAALASGVAVVRVVVPDDELRRGVQSAWIMLFGLGVILVLLAVAVSDRLARSIVKPITSLADTTRALEQGDLSARVVPSGPHEVREVGHTLNLLAVRISELLATEREAIADLSHRLRTPITALRLDAGGLTNPEEAKRIVTDVDELTRAVDQLIRTAREPTRAKAASSDLVASVRQRTEFWHVLAEEQGRRMHVSLPKESVWVNVATEALDAAVDVLIENVFTHTADGSPFQVSVTRTRDRARLAVEDHGSGIGDVPPARGTSSSGSTGLGLSIAQTTATTAGGSLTLEPASTGGLRAVLTLIALERRPADRLAHDS